MSQWSVAYHGTTVESCIIFFLRLSGVLERTWITSESEFKTNFVGGREGCSSGFCDYVILCDDLQTPEFPIVWHSHITKIIVRHSAHRIHALLGSAVQQCPTLAITVRHRPTSLWLSGAVTLVPMTVRHCPTCPMTVRHCPTCPYYSSALSHISLSLSGTVTLPNN